MKTLALKLARATGLFALSRWLTRNELRILCYHGIWIGPAPHYGDCLFMAPSTFSARMKLIADLGYRVLPLDEAVRRHAAGKSSARDIVITIDDAWLGTYRHMVPVLEQHAYPATLYVTTYYTLAQRPVLNVMLAYLVSRATHKIAWDVLLPDHDQTADRDSLVRQLVTAVEALPTLDERHDAVRRIGQQLGVDVGELESRGTFMLMSPEQIRDAAQRGIDIQLHTHTHRMHGHDPAQVAAEIELNRRHLAQILGVDGGTFRHFCYPSGEYHPRVFDALRRCGVQSTTTTEFGLNPPGTEPQALRRILDCQSFSELELEARLSGFWSLVSALRRGLRR